MKLKFLCIAHSTRTGKQTYPMRSGFGKMNLMLQNLFLSRVCGMKQFVMQVMLMKQQKF